MSSLSGEQRVPQSGFRLRAGCAERFHLPGLAVRVAVSASGKPCSIGLFSAADAVLAQSEAQKAAEAYRDRQQARFGQDIVRTQIIEVLHGYGVYSVALPQPAADQVLTDQSWPRCTAITITVVGMAQG